MSFWPLATSLVERLRICAGAAPLIEIGCGDGTFTRRLRSLELRPIGVDRRMPSRSPAICADVLHLPLRDRSVGALVAANLLRHLDESDCRLLGRELRRVARPDAVLVLLEDSPAARDDAERNYRESLEVLAGFDPARGTTLSVEVAAARLASDWPQRVESGQIENEEPVHDPMLPIRWMLARSESDPALRRRCVALAERVARQGMRYGVYEYAILGADG